MNKSVSTISDSEAGPKMTNTMHTAEKNRLIDEAAHIIRKGGVVAFPTETVYGLGADAFNPSAVARIFEIKERPSFDPLIVHIAEMNSLELLCHIENKEGTFKLMEKFWPGPLTIVLPKKQNVPDLVTSGLNTVAVRMPNHPIALELIRKADTPIAAPSANKFGMLSPTQSQHVAKQLPQVDLIIDGGQTSVGIESTVIAVSAHGFRLLRPGAITAAEIEAFMPEIKDTDENKLEAPGQMKSHYSPRIPLYIKGESAIKGNRRNAGYLALGPLQNTGEYQLSLSLSPSYNLTEAAVNLFSALHQFEESGVECIVVEPIPETGIGIAIMDRLRKAAYQYQKE